MKLIYNILLNSEYRAKRETLYRLRCLSHRQLLDCGISPELLSQGIKAWPWKEVTEKNPPLPLSQTIQLSTIAKGINGTRTDDKQDATIELDAA